MQQTRRYETIIIVRPNAGDDEITATIDKVSAIITRDGGEIVRVDKWGLKKLAYLIKKQQQGHYLYLEYAGTPTAVAELERVLRIDDLILKYMTVKLQDIYVPDETAEENDGGSPAEVTEVAGQAE